MSETVSKDQFDEFVKRMKQSFDHIHQRFDEMGRRFDQMHTDLRADIRQMRNWIIGLYGIVVFGFVGSIFISIIKSVVVSGKPAPYQLNRNTEEQKPWVIRPNNAWTGRGWP
jgi:tetrahydromethanopterin S-methyltransferase subunit G